MMEQETLDIISLTTAEEKVERFDHIIGELMTKYFDLVWLARADVDRLMKEERYEILKTIKDIEAKYPAEIKELYEDETNWQHGFNSGMLACLRFLDEYVKDDLWPIEETGGVEIPAEQIRVVDGKEYVQFDGREQALEMFPELDT